MTPVSALRARHRPKYRVIDAGELALLQVWRNDDWKPVLPPLEHATINEYIKTLELGENDVKDERKR